MVKCFVSLPPSELYLIRFKFFVFNLQSSAFSVKSLACFQPKTRGKNKRRNNKKIKAPQPFIKCDYVSKRLLCVVNFHKIWLMMCSHQFMVQKHSKKEQEKKTKQPLQGRDFTYIHTEMPHKDPLLGIYYCFFGKYYKSIRLTKTLP